MASKAVFSGAQPSGKRASGAGKSGGKSRKGRETEEKEEADIRWSYMCPMCEIPVVTNRLPQHMRQCHMKEIEKSVDEEGLKPEKRKQLVHEALLNLQKGPKLQAAAVLKRAQLVHMSTINENVLDYLGRHGEVSKMESDQISRCTGAVSHFLRHYIGSVVVKNKSNFKLVRKAETCACKEVVAREKVYQHENQIETKNPNREELTVNGNLSENDESEEGGAGVQKDQIKGLQEQAEVPETALQPALAVSAAPVSTNLAGPVERDNVKLVSTTAIAPSSDTNRKAGNLKAGQDEGQFFEAFQVELHGSFPNKKAILQRFPNFNPDKVKSWQDKWRTRQRRLRKPHLVESALAQYEKQKWKSMDEAVAYVNRWLQDYRDNHLRSQTTVSWTHRDLDLESIVISSYAKFVETGSKSPSKAKSKEVETSTENGNADEPALPTLTNPVSVSMVEEPVPEYTVAITEPSQPVTSKTVLHNDDRHMANTALENSKGASLLLPRSAAAIENNGESSEEGSIASYLASVLKYSIKEADESFKASTKKIAKKRRKQNRDGCSADILSEIKRKKLR